jgi:hypothetical protein
MGKKKKQSQNAEIDPDESKSRSELLLEYKRLSDEKIRRLSEEK